MSETQSNMFFTSKRKSSRILNKNIQKIDEKTKNEISIFANADIYFDQTINNIHKHNTKGIIISWAIEGQCGYGHCNERNNSYIKQKFLDLGYINDIDEEILLRDVASLPWFKNTIMVFKK